MTANISTDHYIFLHRQRVSKKWLKLVKQPLYTEIALS